MLRLAPLSLLCLSLIVLSGCGPTETAPAENKTATTQNPSEATQTNMAKMPEGAVSAPEPPKGTGEIPDEKKICEAAGIKPYPGAQDVKPEEAKVDLGGDARYTYAFTTADPLTKVAAFYEPQGITGGTSKDQATLIGKSKSGSDIIIAAKKEAEKTQVVIKAIVYKKKA